MAREKERHPSAAFRGKNQRKKRHRLPGREFALDSRGLYIIIEESKRRRMGVIEEQNAGYTGENGKGNKELGSVRFASARHPRALQE